MSQESSAKSIILRLNLSDGLMALLEKGFVISSSPEYLPGSHDYVAQVVSTDGVIVGEYGFGDPRRKYAEWDYIGPLMLDSTDFKRQRGQCSHRCIRPRTMRPTVAKCTLKYSAISR